MLAKEECCPLTPTLSPEIKIRVCVGLGWGEGEPLCQLATTTGNLRTQKNAGVLRLPRWDGFSMRDPAYSAAAAFFLGAAFFLAGAFAGAASSATGSAATSGSGAAAALGT